MFVAERASAERGCLRLEADQQHAVEHRRLQLDAGPECDRVRRDQAANAASDLFRHEKAENDRLKHERVATPSTQSKETCQQILAAKEENDCSNLANFDTHPGETNILPHHFWPTRIELYHSCSEADVRDFFGQRPNAFHCKLAGHGTLSES